jgi:spore coat polysaccharide biosynthesis protein SpsF (cytidylyltransferase family)
MKIGIILQARLGSKRLPKKVLKEINNRSLIDILLNRLSKVCSETSLIVAIPDDRENLKLYEHLKKLEYKFFVYRGSEYDVLKRYYLAAKSYNLDTVVRLTADCPLIDPNLVDLVISKFNSSNCDYMSNVLNNAYPDGMDIEVFKFSALEIAEKEAICSMDREHVTRYIYKSKKFTCKNYSEELVNCDFKFSVDTLHEFELVNIIVNSFYPNIDFKFSEIINFLNKNENKLINYKLKDITNE